MKRLFSGLLVFVFVISVIFVSGCQITGDESTDGALTGALLGVAAGQIFGGDTQDTLLGAGIGGGAGYLYGKGNENKKENQRDIAQLRAEQNTVTVWITNSNGSKKDVNLRRQGPNYVGPRGELYDHLPTEDELRPIYGF